MKILNSTSAKDEFLCDIINMSDTESDCEFNTRPSKDYRTFCANVTALRKFYVANNRYPQHQNIGEIHLSNWIDKVRQQYKEGTLRRNRIEKLNTLRFWVWGDTGAEREIAEYIGFVNQHRRHPSIRGKSSNPRLYYLAVVFTHLYFDGKLSEDDIIAISAIPKWSWHMKHVHSTLKNICLIQQNVKTCTTIRIKHEIRVAHHEGYLPQAIYDLFDKIPKWSWNLYPRTKQ